MGVEEEWCEARVAGVEEGHENVFAVAVYVLCGVRSRFVGVVRSRAGNSYARRRKREGLSFVRRGTSRPSSSRRGRRRLLLGPCWGLTDVSHVLGNDVLDPPVRLEIVKYICAIPHFPRNIAHHALPALSEFFPCLIPEFYILWLIPHVIINGEYAICDNIFTCVESLIEGDMTRFDDDGHGI